MTVVEYGLRSSIMRYSTWRDEPGAAEALWQLSERDLVDLVHRDDREVCSLIAVTVDLMRWVDKGIRPLLVPAIADTAEAVRLRLAVETEES